MGDTGCRCAQVQRPGGEEYGSSLDMKEGWTRYPKQYYMLVIEKSSLK